MYDGGVGILEITCVSTRRIQRAGWYMKKRGQRPNPVPSVIMWEHCVAISPYQAITARNHSFGGAGHNYFIIENTQIPKGIRHRSRFSQYSSRDANISSYVQNKEIKGETPNISPCFLVYCTGESCKPLSGNFKWVLRYNGSKKFKMEGGWRRTGVDFLQKVV